MSLGKQMSREMRTVLESYSASYWLKGAIRASLDRDIVDAIHDAEDLARMLREYHANITAGFVGNGGVVEVQS